MIKNPKVKRNIKRALKIKVIIGLAVLLYLGLSIWEIQSNKQSIRDATYTVLVGGGSGTGVVVRSDETGSILITNKHVCAIALQTKAELNKQKHRPDDAAISTYVLVFAKSAANGAPLIGQVIESADNADLCAIHLMEKDLKTVKIASKGVDLNDKVMAHGSPLGMEDVTSHGKINGFQNWLQMRFITAKLSVRPGSSGSGVYNFKGELVGLISWGAFNNNLAGIVPYEHLMIFLSRFGIK
jgi:S1-C subfamily serine protease